MTTQRQSTKEKRLPVNLFNGMRLGDLWDGLARRFPEIRPADIAFEVDIDDGDVQLLPYRLIPEPEDDYKARVAHEERIAREREIAQADSDRQHRRMLYDKLKAEFEGGTP